MAIGNKGILVTVENPNGSQYTRALSIYTGTLYPLYNASNTYGCIYSREISPIEVIDLKAPTEEGYLTYKLYFAGSIDGAALPPMVITMHRYSPGGREQIDYTLGMVTEGGQTIVPYSASGIQIAVVGDTYLRFAIAKLNTAYPYDYGIAVGNKLENAYYGGEMIQISALSGTYNDATVLYNALTIENYGYPFGPIDDPTKYESKETDTSEATMEDDSDPIEVDDLPSAVVSGGLFGIYEMTNQQLTWLKNELVDPSFIESLARAVTSPWDYVISLKAIPTVFPAYTSPLQIGNKTISMQTNPKLLNGYMKDIDCGSVAIPKFFGSFLDWSPYTSITAYLPFIGYVSLAVDKFIGNHVKLKYRVDVVSGDCVVFVSNDEGLICTYAGNCAYTLPLRANDSNQLFGGLKSALAGLATGNIGQLEAGTMQIAGGVMKPNMVNMSGLSANSGAMGNRKPYLIIERPVIALPKTYGYQKGYRSGISAKLSTLRGFTRVEAIHLDDLAATDVEKADIVATLNTGVILK